MGRTYCTICPSSLKSQSALDVIWTKSPFTALNKLSRYYYYYYYCYYYYYLRKSYSVNLTYFFYNVNISESVTASAVMHRKTSINLDICQRMAPLWKLYLSDVVLRLFGTVCRPTSSRLVLSNRFVRSWKRFYFVNLVPN